MNKARFGHCAPLVFLGTALSLAGAAQAANPVVPIPGVEYQVDWSMEDNLKALDGRRVTVTLDGGNRLSGRVKAVGNGLVHLEKLDNQSFVDALIRIERVDAIETQVRAYERDLERLK